MVLLTLGTGVGGGVIIDGRLYDGEHGVGAELGHSTLVFDGETCTCGRKGCAEAYISATALIKQAKAAAKLHPESLLARVELSARDVYDAMRSGDAVATEVVKQYEIFLGEVVVNMANIFRPETVLIGGGISGEGKSLTDRLEQYVRLHCFGGTQSFVSSVRTAKLGNRAGIVGAAALAFEKKASNTPLKMKPAYKDYIWGGSRLKSEYNKRTDTTPLAESWELSCHEDGASLIENGAFAGMALKNYIALNPSAVGKRFTGGTFPILIKLIDASKPLSVQVHPDDTYAQRVEGEAGKTEMWYIIDAQPGAFLYYGFKHAVTREEVEKCISDGTLTNILNAVPVKKGDSFFIESGTVHAIGAGILIAEIQQNSNTTYRLYDYNRLGVDGKLRPLDIQKALDVACLEPPHYPVGPTEQPKHLTDCTVTPLASCAYFHTELLKLRGCIRKTVDDESFKSLLCLDGQGAVLHLGKPFIFQKGDSLFLPAGIGSYNILGHANIICTTM